MPSTEALLDEAEAELAAAHESRALEILHALFESTDDPVTIEAIRKLAVEAHEASRGFHKIEWKRLAIDAESWEELSVRV